jgi:DNA-binding NarL/FixJ family response regulator
MDVAPRAVSTVRILVVDDFEPWRHTICSILKTQANLHVVGHAADGLEAVRKVSELKPDLILLDISLTSLDGIKVAIRLFQVFPGVRILFVSQHSDPDILQAALHTGARGYVLKMDAASEILPAIQAVLRGEQFLSSRLKGHRSTGAAND